MPTLKEILLVPGNRPKVIADCVKVIEEEVDAKSGLTGLAVKGAFAVVKAVKPGFVPEAVDHMLLVVAIVAGVSWSRRLRTPLAHTRHELTENVRFTKERFT